MNKYSTTLLAVIFSSTSLLSTPALAEDFYEIVDLGGIDGASYSNAYGINQSGQVVVSSDGEGFVAHAFIYENGTSSDLGFLEYLIEADEDAGISRDEGRSFAFAINDLGIAVGYSIETQTEIINEGEDDEQVVTTYLEVPVTFDTNDLSISKVPSFETLVDDRNDLVNARALGLNNNGLIVGTGFFNEPDDTDTDGNESSLLYDRGFIYNQNSAELVKINPLANDLTHHITLRDIDDSGYAVGISAEKVVTTIINKKAVGVDVNSPENVVEFNILDSVSTEASAINESKKVVGRAFLTTGSYQTAYVYDINTETATDLGVLNTNFPYSEAFDINDSDQIVGISQTKSQPDSFSGFIYENGEMKDLSKLIGCDTGWTIHEARSINNSGSIVGTGLLNGEARAFMLNPIAGTAPVCEVDGFDGGSGSNGLNMIYALFILCVYRTKRFS